MLIISDTTPLLHLARVGQLDLLHALFAEVIVPATVWTELTGTKPMAPGVGDLRAAPWLRVVPDTHPPGHVAEALVGIDRGEAAAIALALASAADLLLIDDAAGRRAAAGLGIAVRGTLGVLVAAKAAGRIEAVAPVIDALSADGFWASPAVVELALRAAGESPEAP